MFINSKVAGEYKTYNGPEIKTYIKTYINDYILFFISTI